MQFALLAGLVTVIVTTIVFFCYEEPWALRGDNKLLLFPMMLEAYEQWAAGHLPLWSTGQWTGFPSLTDPTAGTFYFLDFVPFLLTSHPHYRAFDLATALHTGIFVAGTVRLLGRLGAGPVAASFGATLTLMAPQTVWWSGFLGGFAALAWWPWVMVMADDVAKSERLLCGRLAAGSAMLAAQQLAGHPEMGLYTGGVAILWLVTRRSGLPLPARVARGFVFGGAGLLLAAPQVLPTLLALPDTLRDTTPWLANLALRIEGPADLIDPRIAARVHPAESPFVGAATLILAASAILRRTRGSVFLFLVAMVTGIIAAGEASFLYEPLWTLPPFNRFRGALKFFPITQLVVIWLAAIGISQLPRWTSRRRVGLGLAVALGFCAIGEYGYQFRFQFPKAALPHTDGEVSIPSGLEPLRRLQPLLTEQKDSAGPPPRVLMAGASWSNAALGVLYGVESPGGGPIRLLSRRQQLLLRPRMTREEMDLYGVQLEFRPGPCLRVRGRGLEIVHQDEEACVLRNPSWPERYELLSGARFAGSMKEMQEIVRTDPGGLIPLMAPVEEVQRRTEFNELAGVVKIEHFRPGEIHLWVASPRDAWLLVREAWREGWRARIDGEYVPVRPAAGLFFAVGVPSGCHEVTLAYWPPGLGLGLLCACLWVVLAAFMLCPWKTRWSLLRRAISSRLGSKS